MEKKRLFCWLFVILFLLPGLGWAQTPGTLKWAFTTGDDVHSSPAIGSDGTIYVGSGDKELYAINPDGTQKWAFTTGSFGVYSSPAIASDGTIYVGSYDDKLYAINPDGTQKWAFTTAGDVLSSPAIASDGTIYVGSKDSKLYAINLDGTQKWAFTTEEDVRSSPAIGSDGTIYVGSEDNKLYAINPDGTQKWVFATGGDVLSSPAIGSDGTIYVGSWDNKLYAINSDGTQKWAFTTGHDVFSSAAIGSDGTIYVGSVDDKLYAINFDGTQKWAFSTGGDVYSSPALGSDGTIYVGSYDNKVYAINPEGTQKWAFRVTFLVLSSPAIGADGTIYVGSWDNKLYAIYGGSAGLAASPWPKFRQNAQNTGKSESGLFVVDEVSFEFFQSGETVQKWFQINNTASVEICLDNCVFDGSDFSLATSLPIIIAPGASATLTAVIRPDSTRLYQSRCQLTYNVSGETRTTSGQIGAGLFLDDDSELAYVGHQALAAYTASKDADPNSVATVNNLGVLYRLLGEPIIAEQTLFNAVSKGINASYGYSGIKMNIGVTKSDQGQSTGANEFYDYALSDVSSTESSSAIAPQVYYNKAWEDYKEGDLSDATIQVNKTLSHSKVNDFLKAKAYVLLGAIRFQQGKIDSARLDFQQAIALDPDGPIGRMAQENLSLSPVTIPLMPGWNLVSWNVNTSNDSTSVILRDILANVEVVLSYEGEGLIYSPSIPHLSNLQLMDHYHGYWIKMSREDTLVVVGSVVEPGDTPILCEAGWNLVSYFPDKPDSVAHGFSSVLDNLDVALGFNGNGLTYAPQLPQFSTLLILNPTDGYWLRLNQQDELIYPEPLPGLSPARDLDRILLTANNQLGKSVGKLIIPTIEWINLYAQELKINDQLLPVGTVVKAVDPDGKICGSFTVKKAGSFGLMPVYRDDATTEMDEGALPGDVITIYLGELELPEKITWTQMGDIINLSDKISSVMEEQIQLPTTYGLSQNYPNPFNPETKIRYQLPKTSHTILTIYNIMGQEIITLVNEKQEPGNYHVVWKGRDSLGRKVSSGVYVYTIKAGDFTQTRKMVVLK